MITFTAVTKDFGLGSPALDNISFHVNKGEFVFLTGHSGSGKTTLFKLLTHEYTPTTGEILFDTQKLNKLRGSQIHKHRRKIGVVFQDYRLLPELNVWENIALALQIIGKHQHEIEERVTDLLALVQLTDKAYQFPAQLSGGELQRVGIARALATAPGVLLADEPTGNLDHQTTLMIGRLFDKIHELGTTIFFATHDLSILEKFPHRRLHLEKGKLISDSQASSSPATQPASQPVSPASSAPAEAVAKTEPVVMATPPPVVAKPAEPVAPVKPITSEPVVTPPTPVASPAKIETTSAPEKPQPQTPSQQQPKEASQLPSKPPFKISIPKLAMPFGKKKATTATPPSKASKDSAAPENLVAPAKPPLQPTLKTPEQKSMDKELNDVLIQIEDLD